MYSKGFDSVSDECAVSYEVGFLHLCRMGSVLSINVAARRSLSL